MRMTSMRSAVTVLCVVPLALVAGCSRQHYEERGKADSPVSGARGEDSPAEGFNLPDGFGNLATKCVGNGKRGYTTTRAFRGDAEDIEIIPANAVIVDDPECTGSR